MTSLVAGHRNNMVSRTPRGVSSGLSQKSSDQGTHYHVHYHCQDHATPGHNHSVTFGKHNDKHIDNLGHLPFLDIIPSNFNKNNDGRTKVQWSRHSTPQTGGSFQLNWAKRNVTEKPNKTPTTRNKKDSAGARMATVKTETTVRTYTKEGKRYEETTVKETREEEDGTVTTSTKTTTKCIDPFSTTTLASALDGTKKGRGVRKSSSSSSSSDSSPTRVRPQKTKDKAAGGSNKTTTTKTSKSSSSSSSSSLLNKLKKGAKSSDSNEDEQDFAKSVLNSVNEYREKHGVAKLNMSKELNKYAKEWAKKLAKDEKMSHRPEGKYGENVFCLSSNTANFNVEPNEVVDKWYSEVKDHTFGKEPEGTTLKSGHFSQLVWKDTNQMGVGKARSAAGTKVFVVANFDPQGNWMGKFAEQVPPIGGFPKSAISSTKLPTKARKSSSSYSDSDEEGFAKECLRAHNDYRRKHGAPPLKLSQKLNKVAEEWARNISNREVLQHRPNNQYGENLYYCYSSEPNFMIHGAEAVKSWYSEIKDFRFGAEPRDLRAGHFTQVVWSDSKELGVACVKSRSGKIYVVANYNPAGNFVGSFASKVPRLQ